MENKYFIGPSFSHNIIYIYSIPIESHFGRLKIGSASIKTNNPTQTEIYSAAHQRIRQQTATADIEYRLEHAEIAVTNDGNSFKDFDVHSVLIRSSYERKSENIKNGKSEWFEVNLETAINAIKAVKEGRTSLNPNEISNKPLYSFAFRPNQLEAIKKTVNAINSGKKHFLWNAKMRFGKTSAAMQVAKEADMKRVMIVTHRPSVNNDWFDDFNKVFTNTDYKFSSRENGNKIEDVFKNDDPFIYFASLQDLRLSRMVTEDENSGTEAQGFDKNKVVFENDWDMLIIDEAHEGTQSKLGDSTIQKIKSKFTLQLSGTPFNILHKHEENEIYTWDYVMEQEEKTNWDTNNPGVPNPYAELPKLNIFTYDIDTFSSSLGLSKDFSDELDGAFKFHEFFRVHKDEDGNDTAEFVHREMISKFLDLLVDKNLPTKFPFATEEYRNYNKHSLWLLPNRVKIIEAMENLLKDHYLFKEFGIVNISGDSKDEEEDKEAKVKVRNAIKSKDYTITLTGQRLTTGASIPEWTAVFMLSDVTSATTYLQTAFRCQTPASIDGKIKTDGYIFDFAPDRTLKLIAEVIELNHKSSKTNTPEQEAAMQKFLNFCPIISSKNGVMKEYDVSAMLRQLKRAIIQRVSENGFDDPKLYNDNLLKLSEQEIKGFNDLKAIIGKSTKQTINEIVINNLGMEDLQIQKGEELEKKKKELTEEEKELLKKLKEAREQKRTAISILRAVSIRMPMLVYGADVGLKDDITLEKFIELVDNTSWDEFMPKGLTKNKFREFIKFYDEDVFKGVTLSIRAKAKDCDDLLPTDRIIAIAGLFSTFKNPDKETVLTPWNVVNKHLTLAFGGHCFNEGFIFDGKPEWISKDVDTSVWSDENTKILEINSKSGLYPLLAAYNVYSRKIRKIKKQEEDAYLNIWKQVLEENIFVLCKSPMAQSITRRTLAGYNKNINLNLVYIENLVDKLQRKNEFRDYNFKNELYTKFKIGNTEMKFTAVIGNPPYQISKDNNRDAPIYHLFYEESFLLSDRVTLITPARFLFNVGQTPEVWNKKMLGDPHFKVVLFEKSSNKIFPNTDIKGGIIISIRDKNIEFGAIKNFSLIDDVDNIIDKVKKNNFISINSILYGNSTYKFNKFVYEENPFLLKKITLAERFSIGSNIFNRFSEIFLANIEEPKKDFVKVLGRLNNIRVFKFISKRYLNQHPNLEKWKVFIPGANGSGNFGETLSNPQIGEPNTIATQTFISFGAFENQIEAENLIKYIKTKFFRFLLSTLKVTQNNKKKSTWENIPIQNFLQNSDIDWSKSISEIDQQLYKKYNLDQKEIEFIEKNVKPMI